MVYLLGGHGKHHIMYASYIVRDPCPIVSMTQMSVFVYAAIIIRRIVSHMCGNVVGMSVSKVLMCVAHSRFILCALMCVDFYDSHYSSQHCSKNSIEHVFCYVCITFIYLK